MPIVDVEIVVVEADPFPEDLSARLAHAAGEAFGARPGSTWVRVRFLPVRHYAETGDGPGEGVLPVFVSVLRARMPSADRLREEMAELAERVSEVCRRPAEHVHIIYEPSAVGRIAFGGVLMSDPGPVHGAEDG